MIHRKTGFMKAYAKIKKELASLRLSFDKDGEARDVLNCLVTRDNASRLDFLRGKKVVVFAAGKSLSKHLCDESLLRVRRKFVAVATDGALEPLFRARIVPAVVCTDLDSDFRFISKASKSGAIIVVHAHGDNIDELKRLVPRLKGETVATTQVEPLRKVHNFGGFTDGDRAVFLAVHFGARAIGLAGFDAGKKKHKAGLRLVQELKRKNKNIFDLNVKRECAGFMELL